MISGVLLIDKPKGVTSHDVVDAVRKTIGQKKAGHGGTLDPQATGLLVVLLGKATRLVPYLGGDKVYEGTITFGVTTDTLDADGNIVSQNPVKLTLNEIQTAAADFIGEIDQIPPMVSAVKVGGTPLHKLARAGKSVERKPRRVRIDDVELFSFDESGEHPTVDFRVACSGGTYIRVLAGDIGERLGCGAHLSRLVRTGSGRFRLEDAIGLEDLNKLARENRLSERLIPPAAVLELSEIVVDEAGERDIAAGRPVRLRNVLKLPDEPLEKGRFVKITDVNGNLLSVALSVIGHSEIGGSPDAEVARPKKVLIHDLKTRRHRLY